MKKMYVIVFGLMLLFSNCKSNQYADLGDGMYADIKTSKGDIVVKLEYENTPITVANFVSLAEGTNPYVSEQYKDKKYYDGLTFHRVMKDFMIQGGDPTATGTGSPGYKFKDEFSDSLTHSKAGTLSMANPGPNSNGSQFFITHKPTPWLNNRHTVFGEVVSGMPVVDSIANVKVSIEPTTLNKPVTEVKINTIEIVRNGKNAKNFDAPSVMTDYFADEEAALAAIKKTKTDFTQTVASQITTARELPSGLKILSLKEGNGLNPAIGDSVLINYAGWLPNGTLFDTNIQTVAEQYGNFAEINQMHRGIFTPSPMVYSQDAQLIAGFKEGLMSMKIGDKIRLFIPPHLGYGPQGGGPIPPNSNLVFDLEMVSKVNPN